MKRALAILLACSCTSAPIRQQSESEENANLASVQPSAETVTNGQKSLGKAEPCTHSQPCVKSEGVWLPGDLAAQTAGWGEGFVACKAQLAKCDRVGADVAAFVVVGILAGLATGAAVAGAYELRDWLRR